MQVKLFSSGEVTYAESTGGIEEGDFVRYVADPKNGEIKEIEKTEDIGGETLGCIIWYDPSRKIGKIIPAEGEGGKYKGNEVFFHINNVLLTSDELNPYIGQAVKLDINKGRKGIGGSNILLLDDVEVPGIEMELEGKIQNVNAERGFGFIEDGLDGVFFHKGSYQRSEGGWGFGETLPREGMAVIYSTMITSRGKAAFNVRPK